MSMSNFSPCLIIPCFVCLVRKVRDLMLQGTFFHFTLLAVDEMGWGTIVHIYLIKCFRVLDPELPFLVATELLPSIKRQAIGQHVRCDLKCDNE